ncbi:MAG: FixH family protein [Gammaproteobacteria bacterium]|nr:FixH family protein [Gammaproteobacteria bacterium]
MNEVDDRPWYRQFWPWFLISLPLSAVLAGTATIIIANVTFDGLVVDDYYKQGKAINQEKGRDRMATHLGLSAVVNIDLKAGEIRLRLDSKVDIPSQALRLSLIHPTRAGGDIDVVLEAISPGLYQASIASVKVANWNLLLVPEAGQWRLRGRFPGGEQAQVHMQSES